MASVHSTSQVNKIIQLLAQKYCVESRTSFEELSKIVQRSRHVEGTITDLQIIIFG